MAKEQPGSPVFYATPAAAACQALRVDAAAGLTDDEAAARRAKAGENRLPDPPRESELRRVLRQLESPLVLVLIAAAAIATIVGLTDSSGSFFIRFGDAFIILLIVLLNALLGYLQEHRAESALRALTRISAPRARVVRGATPVEVPAASLVPGDVIELQAGDAVPADVRLLSTSDLRVDESLLTGESAPVNKDSELVLPADTPLAERTTMAYLGTLAVHGRGRAVVVATGVYTELGRIALALGTTPNVETPLEATLRLFGRRVLWVCLAVSALLFGWAVWRGESRWHLALLQSVSFAVALIPEGLPAITAIALALGTQRMARRGVIVRRMPAVEALGATSVICTDKTGTLTQNRMTVLSIYCAGKRLDPKEVAEPLLRPLLHTGVLCSDARLAADGQTIQGDPTEAALVRLACQGGCDPTRLVTEHVRIGEVPFSSDRKRMTVLTMGPDKSQRLHVKGSVESVLPLCQKYYEPDGERPLTDADRQAILAELEHMSGGALRVLALAHRSAEGGALDESGLTFIGLTGMLDPPREGVGEAIAACKAAGVGVVMITGDHPSTASAIARQIGLLEPGDAVLTGNDLADLSEDALRERCVRARIFARTTADQKLRIVSAFQKNGHVVAMTGDGVNDAPALREAHVGIAMGRDGTEVARQAADVVLTDDNFVTIVAGIAEGRAIYHNIQKFIVYLLSSNVALALAVFGATFGKGWLPLTAPMILWINLVTNGLPALALGIEAPDPAQMRIAPRRTSDGLFQWVDYAGIALAGVIMGVLALGLYVAPQWSATLSQDPQWARSMAFAVLGIAPMFHVWNCRSRDRSLLTQRPLLPLTLSGAALLSGALHIASLAVPALRPLFHTYPLSANDWLLVFLLSISVLPAVEFTKLLGRRMLRQRSPRSAA